MSAVQASLRVLVSESAVDVARLAANMNRFLHRSTATSSYATFFYAQLDLRGSRMRYVNAGHNPPYLVRRTAPGEILELSCGGTVLGLFPDVEYEEAQVDLQSGDLFVAFTDGVTEARNDDGEEFGEERLKEFLRCAVQASSAEEVSTALAERIRAWIGSAEQHDDVTFVIAAMTPDAPPASATAEIAHHEMP
jgi:sigma-B regulation protein RsbU (phosphoserine phosphatase)